MEAKDLNRRDAETQREKMELLAHLRHLAQYWATQSHETTLGKVEGAIFSTLVALDGEAGALLNGYSVRRRREDGSEGEDISGSLHELFFNPGKEAAK